MKNGFIVTPIMAWLAIMSLAIVAITKTSISTISTQPTPMISQQVSPTPIIITDDDLLNPVKEFYSDVSAKRLNNAWDRLSKNFQSYSNGYDQFVKGYSTTVSTSLDKVKIENPAEHLVFVKLTSLDNINGQINKKTYSGTWKLIPENGSWKLDSTDISVIGKTTTSNSQLVLTTFIPTKSPTHDGTRTGNIIDYFELNSGKQIKVYENELLPYTDIKGKLGYYTQKDIDYLNKMFGNPNDPVEKCSNSYCGDIQVKRSQCGTPDGYYCCNINGHNTWYSSKSKCQDDLNQINRQTQQQQEQLQVKSAENLVNAYEYCLRMAELAKTDPVYGGYGRVTYDYEGTVQYCHNSFKNGFFYDPTGCPVGLGGFCLLNSN